MPSLMAVHEILFEKKKGISQKSKTREYQSKDNNENKMLLERFHHSVNSNSLFGGKSPKTRVCSTKSNQHRTIAYKLDREEQHAG